MNLIFLRTFYRNFTNNMVFSGINIGGLTIGMVCFILLMEYVAFEMTANVDNRQLSNTYRLITVTPEGERFDGTAPGLAGKIADITGVRKTCRVASGIGGGIVNYERQDKTRESFRKADIIYADASVTDMFDLKRSSGSGDVLSKPYQVAISTTLAQTLFPGETVIGRSITVTNQFGPAEYTIGFVFEDALANSDFNSDLILSLATLANPANLNGNDWANLDGLNNQFTTTWLLADEAADKQSMEESINKVEAALNPDDASTISLQNGASVHLGESLGDANPTNGNRKFVYLLSAIAIMILALAWFNYINLSTANALSRAKEVGIRKTVGASRTQLIRQFLTESLVLNAFSAMLALAIVTALQTPFNLIVGKTLSIQYLNNGVFIMTSVLALLAGSVFSGGYVSFVLTRFNPANVLKGKFSNSSTGKTVRQGLVTFQFAASVLLVATTVVLYSQLEYIKTTDVGMDLRNVVVLRGPDVGKDSTYRNRKDLFKTRLQQLPFITTASLSGCVPGGYYSFNAAGITNSNPAPGDEKISYGIAIVDENFFGTYGIRLLAGQNFTEQMTGKGWNDVDKVMINESAARRLGFANAGDAVGQKVLWGKTFEVVGVAADYNHTGLREMVEPIVFYPQQNNHYISLKYGKSPDKREMAMVESIFKDSFAGNPFEYFFADENYGSKYADEQRYGLIFITASCLAIFITIIGLLGLTTFLVNQKAKEISLRKIFGASVTNVAGIISNNFLTQILVGSLIGLPIAWYGCHQWLEGFAYRTSIEWWMLAIAFAVSISFAGMTIFLRCLTAASADPIRHLRNE